MKKIIVLLVIFLSFGGTSLANEESPLSVDKNGVVQFQGMYSGTYSGTDSGTWTVRSDSQGNLTGVSWSQIYEIPDVGSGSLSESGKFIANMDGGAVLRGTIDNQGNVNGSWVNSNTGQRGALEGQKNLPSELKAFIGRYSGSYSGSDYGTWDVVVDSLGNGSGTVKSELYMETYSSYGIVNTSGEITSAISSGSILHGMIDKDGDVSGIWYHPSNGGGTITGEKMSVPPEAPIIMVSTWGVTVHIGWDSIGNALGYVLYYAPPDISYIKSIDLGEDTHFSYDLWEGASFYVAVKAYNQYGSSKYSNIELFEIPSERPSSPGPVTEFTIDTTHEDYNSFTWNDPTDEDLSHIEIWVAKVSPGIPAWSAELTYKMKDLIRYENRVYKCVANDEIKGISPLDPTHGYGGSGEIYWWQQAWPYKTVTFDAWCKALIPTSVEKWTHTLSYTEELQADWYYWARAVDYSGNGSNWRPMQTREGLLAPAKD